MNKHLEELHKIPEEKLPESNLKSHESELNEQLKKIEESEKEINANKAKMEELLKKIVRIK